MTGKYRIAWVTAGLLLSVSVCLFFLHGRARTWHGDEKCIVLGIDGMDPQLLRQLMREGKTPNFSKLAAMGAFKELATSTPPQSPVAWSSLITGMNPGGHGIFDFIHRDPKTMELYFSTSRVVPARHAVHVGPWMLPIGGGSAEQLRKGKAFWQILDERGIPNVVFRIPANFPPVPSKGKTLAGMGTPDVRGSYGTFTFYTDDLTTPSGAVEGGEVVPVRVDNSTVQADLIGPDNMFRSKRAVSLEPFRVALDSVEPVAQIAVGQEKFVLREGEWSSWIHVRFQLVPYLASVDGICRFYLKQAHPRFALYVSPINLDPQAPALPLSTPATYTKDLAEETGEFYTQGIAEDTKALSDGVLDDDEYLQQARTVLTEHRRIFDAEFPKFQRGLFFFYFSSLDLNSHMFWRLMDPNHPEYDPASAARNGGAIAGFYEQMDQVLGEAMARLDNHTTLLVVSDHGFAPYARSFNLNSWLMQNGYLKLRKGMAQDPNQPFAQVDWSGTRAYGLGLNGIYLNVRGRERQGIVGPEADALEQEIARNLEAVRDPINGAAVIRRVERAHDVYTGPYSRTGPDLLVGYNRGYRAGWKTILGGISEDVLEDNSNPWSGDHCIDPSLVPGVVLSNRKIAAASPALTDIAPTILQVFGIAKDKQMMGHSIIASPQ